MVSALEELQGRFSFDLEVIDVDAHPDLEARWGEKVPVLLQGDEEVCHYHLRLEAVNARLVGMK